MTSSETKKTFFKALTAITLLPMMLVSLVNVLNVDATFSIKPAQESHNQYNKDRFIEIVNPGDSITRTLNIYNHNETETSFEIRAKDAVQNADGTITYKDNTEEDNALGSWIELSKETLTLAAGSMDNPTKGQVDFTLTVPANATAGEYVGVISVQEQGEGSGGAIKTVFRTGQSIYVTVPGDLSYGTNINQFNFVTPGTDGYEFISQGAKGAFYDEVKFDIKLENQGNVVTYIGAVSDKTLEEDMEGSIQITGPNGQTELLPFQMQSNIYGEYYVRTYQAKEIKWEVGDYKAVLSFEEVPMNGSVREEGATDLNTKRTATAEFTMTQDILNQMMEEVGEGKSTADDETDGDDEGDLDAEKGSTDLVVSSDDEDDEDNNVIIYSLVGVIVILIVAFALFFFYSQRNKEEQEEAPKAKSKKKK